MASSSRNNLDSCKVINESIIKIGQSFELENVLRLRGTFVESKIPLVLASINDYLIENEITATGDYVTAIHSFEKDDELIVDFEIMISIYKEIIPPSSFPVKCNISFLDKYTVENAISLKCINTNQETAEKATITVYDYLQEKRIEAKGPAYNYFVINNNETTEVIVYICI